MDIFEVNGEDRSKRGKRGGRKRLLELADGSHLVIPANAKTPEAATDLLRPLEVTADVSTLRDRVLAQLATGNFGL